MLFTQTLVPPQHSQFPETFPALSKRRTRDGACVSSDAQAGKGSATLSMAFAAAKFAESCLLALQGQSVIECAYVESHLTELTFFASQVRLGRNGVEVRRLRSGMIIMLLSYQIMDMLVLIFTADSVRLFTAQLCSDCWTLEARELAQHYVVLISVKILLPWTAHTRCERRICRAQARREDDY